MGIYIASKAKHGQRWLDLRALGVEIDSTWIDEFRPGATSDWPDLWTRCVDEAGSADALVCYHEEGDVLKGALVEIGVALKAGIPVHIAAVGPEGSFGQTFVNHPLVTMHSSLEAALAAVGQEPGKPKRTGFAKLCRDVEIFSRIADTMPDANDPSTHHGEARAKARVSFLVEEHRETVEAWESQDFLKFVDGLVDMAYIAVGTAIEFFVPLKSRVEQEFEAALKSLSVEARPGWTADPEAAASFERINFIVNVVNALTLRLHEDGVSRDLGKAISTLLDEILVISILHRVPFDAIWDLVQKANVGKADPATGKFRKREDGKVIKPEGWTPPDAAIEAELRARGWQ